MSLDPARISEMTKDGPVVRILITRTAGSVPRQAGTEMFVWPDRQHGTIGGGRLEFEAVAEARRLLANGGAMERTYPLGPDLGQCCGGSVTLVSEVVTSATVRPIRRITGTAPRPAALDRRAAQMQPGAAPVMIDGWLAEAPLPQKSALWVWGAGHVGRALVSAMAPLPDIEITWADIAPDRFPTDIPAGVNPIVASDPVRLVPYAPKTADHIILTHCHTLDLALCDALLRHGFGSTGLIGSDTKWTRFRNRLAQSGHRAEQIARIACPIGDPALGKHPQAIALGVATRLLARAEMGTQTGQGDSDTA